MLGYSFALGAWCGFDMASLGGMLVAGLYIFIAYTSVNVFRFHNSALRLAWWLLALETVGGVLLLVAADYMNTSKFKLVVALVFASIVLVAWTLPNVAILYKARRLFVAPAIEKPGL